MIHNFREHLTHKHAEMEDIFCKICQKPSNSKVDMILHISRKHSVLLPDGLISCSECQKPMKKEGLKAHVSAVHFNIKTHKCPKCEKSYARKSHFNEHFASVHSSDKKFECELCHSKFKTKLRLRVHKKVTHSEGEGVICPHCGTVFKANNHLKAHILRVHRDHPIVYCEKCGKEFKSKYHLANHMTKYHGTPDVVCEECGKICRSEKGLVQHMKIFHRKKEPLICPHEECRQVFKTKGGLKLHVQLVHDKVPLERKHSCSYCTKKFHNQKAVERHVNTTHLSKREIKCEQCEYTTNYPHSLKKHMEAIHLGIMYDCDYPGCTKSYNKKGNLDAHKSRVHKIPTPKAKL